MSTKPNVLAYFFREATAFGGVGHAGADVVFAACSRAMWTRDTRLSGSPRRSRGRSLDRGAGLADPALASAIPIAALLDAAVTDPASAAALRARRHPEFLVGRAEGRAEALLEVLAWRGLAPTGEERSRVLAERDLARLDRWFAAARDCASVADLLARP